MSGMDFVNFFHIMELQQDNRNQTRMLEMQGRAQHIAKVTGKEPLNWYEFKQADKGKDGKGSGLNAALGGLIGLGLMLGLGMAMVASTPAFIALGAIGLLGGSLIGSRFQHQDEVRHRQLDRYEQYLTKFEHMVGRGKEYVVDKMPPLREGDNVERLRDAVPSCGCHRK